ncbi:unnamed protein product [Polarella glacialis]|uniref:BTB domain-containing protein n=1 Tax=Polarella glacialis TaxID=89957 RepID=A0A813DM51_POLGL|nr:unnamed protein product [Polarella glacialis]
MKMGACDGAVRDASGHSVLWHAIAFGHVGLASLVLDEFPAGSQVGADPTEVHPRKGDTLLHLLCQCRPFTAETAELFKRVSSVMPRLLFVKHNAAGHSFLAMAALSLNFWVLKFVSVNYPEETKAIVCSPEAPLRSLAGNIPEPCPPSFVPPDPIPEHFAVASLLAQDESGRVRFADVAFDVGPDDSTCRFLAHRVVVGAQSPVFLEELDRLPVHELKQERISCRIFRVDQRISKDVWRGVLQFLYTGVVHCSFTNDPVLMVELLRACALYRLPKPLLDLAQTALFQLMPSFPPEIALQVFSITAGSGGQDLDVRSAREASAYILLRSAPMVLQALEASDAAQILDSMIQTVEKAFFHASTQPQAAPGVGLPTAHSSPRPHGAAPSGQVPYVAPGQAAAGY